MTIEEIEVEDLEDLKRLADHDEFQAEFGAAKIQRHLLLGYNRSCRLIERGIAAGVLEKVGKDLIPVRFTRVG